MTVQVREPDHRSPGTTSAVERRPPGASPAGSLPGPPRPPGASPSQRRASPAAAGHRRQPPGRKPAVLAQRRCGAAAGRWRASSAASPEGRPQPSSHPSTRCYPAPSRASPHHGRASSSPAHPPLHNHGAAPPQEDLAGTGGAQPVRSAPVPAPGRGDHLRPRHIAPRPDQLAGGAAAGEKIK